MNGVFVTATGTDIGKTFVTAGLIHHLRQQGRAVDALKPVVSGFDPTDPAGSDPAVLLAALGRPVTPEEIESMSPWQFAAPLSPDMAAAKEGRTLDFDALVDACRHRIAATGDILFIEGVGGVMVPLDDRHTVLDWMAALHLPVLLVAGSYLGTISHTLTALDVLTRRDLAVAAIVVSESAGSTVDLFDTAGAIARFAVTVPVAPIRRLPAAVDQKAFAQLAALL